jgi:hypothetical protein
MAVDLSRVNSELNEQVQRLNERCDRHIKSNMELLRALTACSAELSNTKKEREEEQLANSLKITELNNTIESLKEQEPSPAEILLQKKVELLEKLVSDLTFDIDGYAIAERNYETTAVAHCREIDAMHRANSELKKEIKALSEKLKRANKSQEEYKKERDEFLLKYEVAKKEQLMKEESASVYRRAMDAIKCDYEDLKEKNTPELLHVTKFNELVEENRLLKEKILTLDEEAVHNVASYVELTNTLKQLEKDAQRCKLDAPDLVEKNAELEKQVANLLQRASYSQRMIKIKQQIIDKLQEEIATGFKEATEAANL